MFNHVIPPLAIPLLTPTPLQHYTPLSLTFFSPNLYLLITLPSNSLLNSLSSAYPYPPELAIASGIHIHHIAIPRRRHIHTHPSLHDISNLFTHRHLCFSRLFGADLLVLIFLSFFLPS
jgi:hypothetical protein